MKTRSFFLQQLKNIEILTKCTEKLQQHIQKSFIYLLLIFKQINMKHKLKKILLLYLLSGMLFVSCSLEEEYLKQDNANLKIKIERKTFHELMKEEKFNAAYTKISKQKNPISSSALGRTVMEAEYDFTISNIPAKVITYGNNISYSFHINRNVSNSNYFENLVVKVDSTTIPKA